MNNGYRKLNEALREARQKKLTPKLAGQRDDMDAMIAKNQLPYDVVLHRGLRIADLRKAIEARLEKISALEPYVFPNDGFVSASFSQEVAVNFANYNMLEGIVVEFVGREGSNFTKGTRYEQELILQRGSNFIVYEARLQNRLLFVKAIIQKIKKAGE